MSLDLSSKVKIFVGYFKPCIIFESNVFQPILTASIDWDDNRVIKDNLGINISDKNKYYAELTGHYWVWKNFLQTTDAEYIGFCHYRRFFDFNMTQMPNIPFMPILTNDFEKLFSQYSEENILKRIEGYDIVLPHRFKFENEILTQYIEYHNPRDLSIALDLIKEMYPDYFLPTLKFISSKEMYPCLQFIMKKELLSEYFEWIFTFLNILEQRINWENYTEYMDVRTPAYIAERFFNVWLEKNIGSSNLKVLHSSSFILTGEGYGEISYKDYSLSYNKAAKSKLYE